VGFLTAVPVLYRWIAIALLAVALFGYGYVKGARHVQDKYDAFVSQVEAEGRIAQERAAERTRAAERATKEVSDGYAETLTAVRNDYDKRLRDAYSRARRVPNPTPAAPVPHVGTESGAVPDTELRNKIDSLEIEIAEIEKRLAEAAVQIEAWKEYGRKVKEWADATSTSGTSSGGLRVSEAASSF